MHIHQNMMLAATIFPHKIIKFPHKLAFWGQIYINPINLKKYLKECSALTGVHPLHNHALNDLDLLVAIIPQTVEIDLDLLAADHDLVLALGHGLAEVSNYREERCFITVDGQVGQVGGLG